MLSGHEAHAAAGLDELEQMAREQFGDSPAGKGRYLPIALENIADARGDVDGYIAAQRLAGREARAVREIAERLVAAGWLEEALDWAERTDVQTFERENIAWSKVDILDRLGRAENAQAVRWSIFATSLSPDILAEYLGRLPEVARGGSPKGDLGRPRTSRPPPGLATVGRPRSRCRGRAGAAVSRPDPGSGLLCAAACRRPSGGNPPVAAILVYHKMADTVLRRGQSLQYDHAVRDLVAAERLVPNVKDWLGQLSQEAYRRRVATEHRQKRAFWQKMERTGLSWRG